MKRIWLLIVILIIAGCGAANEENENKDSNEESQESVIFRQIDITVDGDQINIVGEVKSWDGNFYFHILQGEEIVKEEEVISSEHIGFWTPFNIVLSKESDIPLSDEVPHIVLYGKNQEGEQINPNYVPMDLGD